MTKTRVYAIEERGDVHELIDEHFIQIAEQQGNVFSLKGFQDFLNCEGPQRNQSSVTRERFFSYLHFRFIDVEVSWSIKRKSSAARN